MVHHGVIGVRLDGIIDGGALNAIVCEGRSCSVVGAPEGVILGIEMIEFLAEVFISASGPQFGDNLVYAAFRCGGGVVEFVDERACFIGPQRRNLLDGDLCSVMGVLERRVLAGGRAFRFDVLVEPARDVERALSIARGCLLSLFLRGPARLWELALCRIVNISEKILEWSAEAGPDGDTLFFILDGDRGAVDGLVLTRCRFVRRRAVLGGGFILRLIACRLGGLATGIGG